MRVTQSCHQQPETYEVTNSDHPLKLTPPVPVHFTVTVLLLRVSVSNRTVCCVTVTCQSLVAKKVNMCVCVCVLDVWKFLCSTYSFPCFLLRVLKSLLLPVVVLTCVITITTD